MKRCNYITCWTDRPFKELGDVGHAPSPIRRVQVLCYDGYGYATVRDIDTDVIEHIKVGYLYRKPERCKIVTYTGERLPKGPLSTYKTQGVGMSELVAILSRVYIHPKQVNPRKLERMVPQIID